MTNAIWFLAGAFAGDNAGTIGARLFCFLADRVGWRLALPVPFLVLFAWILGGLYVHDHFLGPYRSLLCESALCAYLHRGSIGRWLRRGGKAAKASLTKVQELALRREMAGAR